MPKEARLSSQIKICCYKHPSMCYSQRYRWLQAVWSGVSMGRGCPRQGQWEASGEAAAWFCSSGLSSEWFLFPLRLPLISMNRGKGIKDSSSFGVWKIFTSKWQPKCSGSSALSLDHLPAPWPVSLLTFEAGLGAYLPLGSGKAKHVTTFLARAALYICGLFSKWWK